MGTSIRLYGGSNSSMSAHVPIQAGLNFGDQQIFYCGFRWIFLKILIETKIDRKHRSIILIEKKSIKCLGPARRAFCGVKFAVNIFRWIFCGLTLWVIFSTNVFWPGNVWQTFCCAYVLSLLSWLVFLEISGFDGIGGSNRNSKHPMYPDCNWR